jgi:hypothetical protein
MMMPRTQRWLAGGWLLFLVLLMAGRLVAAVGTGQAKPDFAGLQHAVAQLQEAPLAEHEATRQAVTEVRDRADTFQTLLQDAGPSPEGQAAVQHLGALLRQIATERSSAEAQDALADVRRDLDLKIQYFHSRMGVAGAARGFVTVTVNTLCQGRPVLGLVVYCNAYRWADEARPMQTFSRVSSPTDATMLPGYYRCFAAAGQPAKRKASRDVAIGLDGKDAVTVDIVVPE